MLDANKIEGLSIEIVGRRFRADSYCKIHLSGRNSDSIVCLNSDFYYWAKKLLKRFGADVKTLDFLLTTYKKIPVGRFAAVSP